MEEHQESYEDMFSHTDPIELLNDISEYYANYEFCCETDPDKILEYASNKFSSIQNISTYINKQDSSGDNEFIYTFDWVCTSDVELMKKWFVLLYKLGGDPTIKNNKGKNAFDVCRDRMIKEGYDEKDISEFLDSLVLAS
jgi:hypothetical protein